MKVSYSRVNCYDSCPFKYKLKYINKLETKFDEKATNPLHLGTCVHEGIEKRSVDEAVKLYRSKYNVWTNDHDIEMWKLLNILPKAIEQIPEGEYEHKLDDEEFVGYIDCLVPVSEGVYDLLDFKYTDKPSRYKKSGQVHLYKYYYEKLTGNTIRDMYYVIIPKNKDKLEEGISKEELSQKITESISKKDIKFEKIEYDPQQVNFFLTKKAVLEQATVFEKRFSSLCDYCDYKLLCLSCMKDLSELTEESKQKIINKQDSVKEVKLF